MKKQKQDVVVALLKLSGEAIDMTPIRYFQVVKPLRMGQIIRWDEESTVVTLAEVLPRRQKRSSI